MSYSNGSKRIVTNGLVLALDAMDSNSYPGSGTSWYNLAGPEVGALTNGPIYTTDNGGTINFDGSNDIISIPNSTNLSPTAGISIDSWINPDTYGYYYGAGVYYGRIISKIGDLSARDYDLNIFYSSAEPATIQFRTNTINTTGPSNIIQLNTWQHIAITFDLSTLKFFKNGELIQTTSAVTTIPVSNANIVIGNFGNMAYPRYFNGDISVVNMYNRALSDQEILQNFNAKRSRFNI